MPKENESNGIEVATTMVVDKIKPVDTTNFNYMIPAISNTRKQNNKLEILRLCQRHFQNKI